MTHSPAVITNIQDYKEIINKSVVQTFEMIFGICPEVAEERFSCTGDLGQEGLTISGMTALIEKQFEGTFSFGLKTRTAERLFTHLYGEEVTYESELVRSGIAEITNITSCLLKEKLNENGSQFQPSIPLVVVGGNHDILAQFRFPTLNMKFASDFGEFYINLIFFEPAVIGQGAV